MGAGPRAAANDVKWCLKLGEMAGRIIGGK